MKIIMFSAKRYDEEYFVNGNNTYHHNIRFVEARLTIDTVSLIKDEECVCVFVNDNVQ